MNGKNGVNAGKGYDTAADVYDILKLRDCDTQENWKWSQPYWKLYKIDDDDIPFQMYASSHNIVTNRLESQERHILIVGHFAHVDEKSF